MAGVDVLVPPGPDEVRQAINALPQVDRIGGEQDANGAREEEHRPYPSAANNSAR